MANVCICCSTKIGYFDVEKKIRDNDSVSICGTCYIKFAPSFDLIDKARSVEELFETQKGAMETLERCRFSQQGFDYLKSCIDDAFSQRLNQLDPTYFEREERKRLEKEAEELRIYESNSHYEYATEYLYDVNGILPKEKLSTVLQEYASKGWRLHTAITNEVGVNRFSHSFGNIALGTNSTVDVTILIFERCIRK